MSGYGMEKEIKFCVKFLMRIIIIYNALRFFSALKAGHNAIGIGVSDSQGYL